MSTYAERFVRVAVKHSSAYAATYAECCGGIASSAFHSAVRITILDMWQSSSTDIRMSLVDVGGCVIEFWKYRILRDDDLLRALLHALQTETEIQNEDDIQHLDADARMEAVLRATRQLGVAFVPRDSEFKAQFFTMRERIHRACSIESREKMKRRGASARLVLLAEDVDIMLTSEQTEEYANTGENTNTNHKHRRRMFGRPAPAVSRADVHALMQKDMKSLVVTYEDEDKDKDASMTKTERGYKKGWVFWYVGAPIVNHSSTAGTYPAFRFAGARDRDDDDADYSHGKPRFVPV
jgi:hypothetical protein